ncbi:hypothetical protein [Methanobrevibacter millerae]|uniref:hypothetical protein n=1 Tax=Methanobrevibacter millerae TaxID=230361 RepID=UPI0009F9DEE0|nr:hypothetical protein [Methanobrevibacter millerae]
MELMLIHHLNDSKFLIRLPTDNYENERKWMTTNDETITIKLNHNRKQNFKDEKLKEIASKLQQIDFRIKEIELTDKKRKPLHRNTNQQFRKRNIHNRRYKRIIQKKMENRN